MATQPQIVTEFQIQKRWYIIHNASTKPVERMFIGTIFTFPGRDDLGTKPGLYDNGRPIPGTLVVEDAYGPGAPDWAASDSGEERMIMDAGSAVRFLLGIDKSGHATSANALSGLSLVPKNSTEEQVQIIVESGIRRYVKSRQQWARDTVQGYNEKAAKHKMHGLDNPPPGEDYDEALAILNELKASQAQAAKTAGLLEADTSPEDDELAFIAFAKAKAAEMAEQAGTDILSPAARAKLAESMLEDPKVKLILKNKWRIRKRGRNEETDAQLQEQADAQDTQLEGDDQLQKV